MGRTGRIALLVIALLAVPVWAQAPVAFGRGELEIETRQGRHHFAVELATTSDQQVQGLMFRRALAPDAGMLFLYDDDHEIQMWMKNTLIPLDMVFIKADGTILNVAERTVPQSLATIGSKGPARAVLEVNGGTAARLGIKPGDRIVHPAFPGS
ncbi:MAG: DUF192 domain-containing protein [Proteobacteria bacterium]|nr:DUF192 domain-containing protein [Pseudomonadota bacterium]